MLRGRALSNWRTEQYELIALKEKATVKLIQIRKVKSRKGLLLQAVNTMDRMNNNIDLLINKTPTNK